MLSALEMQIIADYDFERMRARLGLRGVEHTLLYNERLPREKTDDGWPVFTRAEVRVDPLYGRLTIRIDPTHVRDKHTALEVLRHELLHWFQRHFDLHHARVMQAVSEDAAASIEESMSQARELFVLDLERMLDAAGLTPEALAAPFPPAPPGPPSATGFQPVPSAAPATTPASTPAPKPKAAKLRPPTAAPAATRST